MYTKFSEERYQFQTFVANQVLLFARLFTQTASLRSNLGHQTKSCSLHVFHLDSFVMLKSGTSDQVLLFVCLFTQTASLHSNPEHQTKSCSLHVFSFRQLRYAQIWNIRPSPALCMSFHFDSFVTLKSRTSDQVLLFVCLFAQTASLRSNPEHQTKSFSLHVFSFRQLHYAQIRNIRPSPSLCMSFHLDGFVTLKSETSDQVLLFVCLFIQTASLRSNLEHQTNPALCMYFHFDSFVTQNQKHQTKSFSLHVFSFRQLHYAQIRNIRPILLFACLFIQTASIR